MTWETMIILSALAALVAVSYMVEALRSAPVAPDRLDWAPDVPIRYVDVKGTKLRYIASGQGPDRKSTRLNSSHRTISYAVFCLKKKKKKKQSHDHKNRTITLEHD